MSEYTYKNVIIDPTSEDAKACIGKRVYYSTNPTSCLQYANDHEMNACKVLEGINPDDIYPFGLKGNNIFCSCIILCEEEPEPEYVPFESVEEFVERYMEVRKEAELGSLNDNLFQCGMWLIEKGPNFDGYCLVTEIWYNGVDVGSNVASPGDFTIWDNLYEGYTFLDGSPCGKLRETK